MQHAGCDFWQVCMQPSSKELRSVAVAVPFVGVAAPCPLEDKHAFANCPALSLMTRQKRLSSFSHHGFGLWTVGIRQLGSKDE